MTLCPLCHKHPIRESCDICNTCMGFPVYEEEKKMEKCTCKDCGKEFEPYKTGAWMVRNMCWDCMRSKKLKSYAATKKKIKELLKKEAEAVVTPEPVSEPSPGPTNGHTVTLDFSRYPWALDYAKYAYAGDELAVQLVRDFAEQVPSEWLKNHLMDGGQH